MRNIEIKIVITVPADVKVCTPKSVWPLDTAREEGKPNATAPDGPEDMAEPEQQKYIRPSELLMRGYQPKDLEPEGAPGEPETMPGVEVTRGADGSTFKEI